ncbi:hypothetical protein PRCB_17505 [Pantoea rodasii]|uniref:Uncharacterized protein n=1 Tax=Pantoea rodasii TaxID=1076549 RepID=A0A2M9W952_9GAMM|nr:hypothetical protein HA45_12645 [Pantoea rodasii]PJZ04077.1 hypothetical protein PRCB_17505 [Pantoea rodasii]
MLRTGNKLVFHLDINICQSQSCHFFAAYQSQDQKQSLDQASRLKYEVCILASNLSQKARSESSGGKTQLIGQP